MGFNLKNFDYKGRIYCNNTSFNKVRFVSEGYFYDDNNELVKKGFNDDNTKYNEFIISGSYGYFYVHLCDVIYPLIVSFLNKGSIWNNGVSKFSSSEQVDLMKFIKDKDNYNVLKSLLASDSLLKTKEFLYYNFSDFLVLYNEIYQNISLDEKERLSLKKLDLLKEFYGEVTSNKKQDLLEIVADNEKTLFRDIDSTIDVAKNNTLVLDLLNSKHM